MAIAMAEKQADNGVALALPTSMSSIFDRLDQALESLDAAEQKIISARIEIEKIKRMREEWKKQKHS